MIRDLCLKENFACIHAVTPEGGAGKSKYNNAEIDIYERFKFNIIKRKGIASSVFKNSGGYQKKFGSQGLIIYDGFINNANFSDAGSSFNDITGKWETTEGTNDPNINQTIEEINRSTGSYVELNIYDYKICGFFIDLTDLFYCKYCIRSLKEFYENTSKYELPYYGLSSLGLIEINKDYIENEDWRRIEGGTFVSIADIYSIERKII
jgi:hypothetical protein